ncbi:AlpA family phage regulatory protein [Bradyrhizobium yuanmingense]|uniref:helix-turn-helix transcriptional regulator n=1 Tax=Bradyrhizobium yuanmingense TaxID=108015 RepID=UPI0023B8EFCC|nr:AlpA family phage regulatory protein [Bradyrhizobium yuanmingense]MDF0520651.1 AlpA family phage regulatory protein [Bradyrhizobium yuanmingense]
MRLLAVDEDLPGFGVYTGSDHRLVYAIATETGGVPVTEVIGSITEMSFEQARRVALERRSAQKPPSPDPVRTHAKRPVKRHLHPPRNRKGQAAPTESVRRVEVSAPPPDSPRKLLTFAELKSKYNIPLGRRQIDRLEAEGKFPKRVPIGVQRVAWIATEIEAFIETRIAKRSEALGTLGSGGALRRNQRAP